MRLVLSCLLITSLVNCACASTGDRSRFFQRCLNSCKDSCDDGSFEKNQTTYMKVMGWTCEEECKYDCMWDTVEIFKEAGHKVPQFYGKWPFKRILGVQEPASTLFSILNGLTHVIGYRRYVKTVPSGAPMYKNVHFQVIVAYNAWFWSTVFHARDFIWTERMDYFSATALVLTALYTTIYRYTMDIENSKRQALLRTASKSFLIGMYIGHCCYLIEDFDYDYNMKMNVCFGLCAAVLWYKFCWSKWNVLNYVWKIGLYTFLLNSFLLFELLDFPPIGWMIDSHATWHLLTIPLPFILLSFLTDDGLYLLQREKKQNSD